MKSLEDMLDKEKERTWHNRVHFNRIEVKAACFNIISDYLNAIFILRMKDKDQGSSKSPFMGNPKWETLLDALFGKNPTIRYGREFEFYYLPFNTYMS